MNMSYLDRYKGYPSRIEGILLEEFGVLEDAPEITDGSIISGKVIDEEGTKVLQAELRVDSESDLPAADSIEGYTLSNCIALVVHTGDIWAQDSAGTWYNQTNPTPAVSSSLNSSLGRTILKPDIEDTLVKHDIEEDYPEEEELRGDEDGIDI